MKCINNYLAYLLAIPFYLHSISAHTTVLENGANLVDMAELSDSVLIATPVDAFTKKSAQGNLFTEILLSDAQALNNGRVQFIDQNISIYLWGGVRDSAGNVATLNTPPPHILEFINGTPNLEFGRPHLFYLQGNGSVGMPFVNSEFGVYQILSNGQLISSDRTLRVVQTVDESGNRNPVLQFIFEGNTVGDLLPEQDSINQNLQSVDVEVVTVDEILTLIGNKSPRFVDPLFTNSNTRLSPIFVE